MSAAWVKHPRSTRILAWTFAIGAVVLTAGAVAGTVGLVVACVRGQNEHQDRNHNQGATA